MGKAANILSLVVAPPIRDFYFSRQRLSWLGASALASRLTNLGHNVKLLIAPTSTANITQVPLPSYFNYLKPFLNLPLPKEFSFFKGLYRLGPSLKDFAKTVASYQAQNIFISNFAYSYSDDAIKLATLIRQLQPDVNLTIGGAGTSVNPDYFLQTKLFDSVEIDKSCSALPTVLSEIPLPKNEVKLVTILSKGCPRSCSFCSNHLTQGKKFSHISEQQFLSLLAQKQKELTDKNLVCTQFDIEDDNLLLDKKFFLFVLKAINQYFPQAKIFCENGLDYLLLDETLIDLLKEHNFTQLNLALASVSPNTLLNLERKSNMDKLLKICNYANKLSIKPIVYFICGTKYDTPLHVIKAFKFIKAAKALPGISLFYPVPGLLGFEDFSIFKKGESHKTLSAAAYPWSKTLSTQTMVTSFILSRIFYNHQNSKYYFGRSNLSQYQNLTPTFFENLNLDMELIYRFFDSKII